MGVLSKELADAGRSLREVFPNPGLRRVQLAFAGSMIGDWAYAKAFAVYAYEHGGATAVGVVVTLRYILRAFATPFTSVLASPAALRRIDSVALVPPGLELALVRVEFAEGDVVMREGDHGDRFYVVESGGVTVSKEGRFVASLGPGDYVGEIALLRDVPRTATVTATEPTVLQALDRQHFVPAITGQDEFTDAADTAIIARLAML